MNLFSELKSRNVIRGAIAYAALAWLVVEVGSVVLPTFDAPEWALRGLIILVTAGFIPALVIIWRYEWTPKGVMTEAAAEAAGTDSRFRSRRIDVAIIAVLGVAVALLIAERLTLDSRDAVNETVGLAVLPFDYLSASEDDAYIAGGMHEELLSNLARLPDLRLISRTSMMRIAQSALTVPEIGLRLGVSHVLEGSLRRDGDRVRITVQLIDAAADEHVWADNFERNLGDLFALQSDVALAIAAQLHRTLSTKTIAAIRETPTTNPRAYRMYLQAIDVVRSSRGLGDSDNEVIKGLLEQALELDPDFVLAKEFLATKLSGEQALRLVTEIRQRWPDHVSAQRGLALYRYGVEEDYAGALEAFQRVVAELPSDIVAVVGVRNANKRLDRRAEYLYWSRRAVEISPESRIVANEHVLALLANYHLDEALAFTEASAARFPEDDSWKIDAARYRLDLFGDVEAYLEAGEKYRLEGQWARLGALSWLYYARGNLELAQAHLEARREGEYGWPSAAADMDEALMLRQEGRNEEAQALAERAYAFLADGVDRAVAGYEWGREFLLIFAQAAAIARMPEEAARLQQLEEQLPQSSFFVVEANADIERAYLHAYLGDPEAGWALFEPWADDPFIWRTRAFFRVSPLDQLLFGEVAAFQEFIAGED